MYFATSFRGAAACATELSPIASAAVINIAFGFFILLSFEVVSGTAVELRGRSTDPDFSNR
jgi:hypothetical protein